MEKNAKNFKMFYLQLVYPIRCSQVSGPMKDIIPWKRNWEGRETPVSSKYEVYEVCCSFHLTVR